MFTSALLILPKFIWLQIASFLDPCYSIKLHLVHRSFEHIFDEKYYQDKFLNHRKHRIAVVISEKDKNEANYWRHAFVTYHGRNHLHEMFDPIKDIHHNLVCRIYLTGGVYDESLYDYDNGMSFDLESKIDYIIELIGSDPINNPTKICFNSNFIDWMDITIPKYFSMTNIVFDNIKFSLGNYSLTNSILENRDTNCILNGCIFIKSDLSITNVNNYKITNCRFYDSIIYIRTYFNVVLCKYSTIVPCSPTIIINGSISDCMFDSELTYHIDFSGYTIEYLTSKITLTNNTLNSTTPNATLFRSDDQYFPLIKLTADTITNIERLFVNDMPQERICMDNSNVLINCGDNLISYIKTRNDTG